ncbi:MAG: HAD-IIIC family phosphatase [Sulfurospirillaceae bacterium]|jgi:FkbH-like protein|nr:HAD-IIIC family phosphatase [Sulfurospirillaceae bacterium]NLM99287.1 HAD-IIIC family phosphatase [Campylobacteraceae bacterium]
MKYSEIIKENKKLENNSSHKYKIAILSNIMVHQSKEICEYTLRKDGINAEVILGDYDNVVQDSKKFRDANAVLIFWEIYNLIDNLEHRAELLSENELQAIVDRAKLEIDMVLQNLKDSSLIIINRFSSLIFNQQTLAQNRLDILTDQLNSYLESKNGIVLVYIDKVLANISIQKAIDLRYYYSSKTLYSIEFYKRYFKHIKPLFMNANGKIKKALIFDCDNTLWEGILGEDGFSNIKIYKDIQSLAVALARRGVIIGLCSKNNPQDVDEVLLNHPDMILKDEHIVIKKVNWKNKASNLRAIAKELNIGLDSLVFVDDSDFEINLIKDELPMVESLQVPKRKYEYSMMMRNILNFFYNPSATREDLEKVAMYKSQLQRAKEEESITDIEEYLKSLGLNITYFIDDINQVDRISQMTQKTNQFNLTTKRYTVTDIKSFISDLHRSVISIAVSDKYGDSGVVGLAIIEYHNDLATIDTLLMSCRVLGRNIEYRFMDIIIDVVSKKRASKILASYIKTPKNEQVADLYDRCGFEVVKKTATQNKYQLICKEYKTKELSYIGVKDGK